MADPEPRASISARAFLGASAAAFAALAALEVAGFRAPAGLAYAVHGVLASGPLLFLVSRGDVEGLKLLLLLLAISPLASASLAALLLLGGAEWNAVAAVQPAFLAGVAAVAWLRARDMRIALDPGRGPLVLLAVSAALTIATAIPAVRSPAVRASYHGYLHSSIAYSILERGLPAMNPYFAEERVPYYWLYHLFGALLARTGGATPIHAFVAWNLQALFVALPLLALAAEPLFRDFRRQALAAGVALFGLNVFGWAWFLPRFERAREKFEDAEQPLYALRLLTFDWDDRLNAPLTKFLNASSFPGSLALLFVYLYAAGKVVERRRSPWGPVAAAAIFGAVALSPHLGASVAAASVGAFGAIALARGRLAPWGRAEEAPAAGAVRAIGWTGLGVAIVAPYLVSILSAFGPLAEHPVEATAFASRVWQGTAPIALPLLLAVPGLVIAVRARSSPGAYLAFVGAALLVEHAAFTLPWDTQYKIVRLAAFPIGLLSGEAAAWIAGLRPVRAGEEVRFRPGGLVLLAAILLPTSLVAEGVYLAASERAPRVVESGSEFRPAPGADPKEPLYEYLRRETPPDSVVVVDPTRVRTLGGGPLQGNELPLYARRAIFVDRANYMTEGYATFPRRQEIVRRLYVEGPGVEVLRELRALGRAVFVMSYPETPVGFFQASPDLAPVFEHGGFGLHRLVEAPR